MTAEVVRADGVYLRSYLGPFVGLLARADVTDIYVNRPGELWAETLGGQIERHDAPALDSAMLDRLARQVAAGSSQGISREHPILSGTLPDGARMQIVIPPATRGAVAVAIRKHISQGLSLDDYDAAGAFDQTSVAAGLQREGLGDLTAQLARGQIHGALRTAVRQRRNILVSGGTSTGKTTFLNALMREIPATERLILIEDAPELVLDHPNAVGLLAARSALGEASVTVDDLVSASLRMRPDRIILGELRGPEAFAFLRAINTGHPGSMTTVHADSAESAADQIALLVMQAGTRLNRADVRHYIESTVDIFVQLARTAGRRHVAGITLRSVAE